MCRHFSIALKRQREWLPLVWIKQESKRERILRRKSRDELDLDLDASSSKDAQDTQDDEFSEIDSKDGADTIENGIAGASKDGTAYSSEDTNKDGIASSSKDTSKDDTACFSKDGTASSSKDTTKDGIASTIVRIGNLNFPKDNLTGPIADTSNPAQEVLRDVVTAAKMAKAKIKMRSC